MISRTEYLDDYGLQVDPLFDLVDQLQKEAEEADKELERKNKWIARLHEDYKIQTKCIADQHDLLEAKDKLIGATIEAVEHMQYKLKHQPDIASMDHGINDRVLIDCKKVVNQLLKYLTKGENP